MMHGDMLVVEVRIYDKGMGGYLLMHYSVHHRHSEISSSLERFH